ncbi:MAG: hypothetical protein IRZ00_02515 [Gemmatimonadetes bacterium]|nr:hypothetical protein [Gemmatimonadota bacterium]
MSDKRLRAVAGAVRQSDIEPYTALQWVSRLFKAAAVFLVVALIGEFVAGLQFQGVSSLPVLLGEAARTFVFAIVLWGGGDLVRLLVHLGHDIRAERILLARLVHRTPAAGGLEAEGEEAGDEAGRPADARAAPEAEPPRRPEKLIFPEAGAAD